MHRRGQLLVFRLVEHLPAVGAGTRGRGGKKGRTAVHVGHPLCWHITARTHVVVGDRLRRELLAPFAGHGVEAGGDDLTVLVLQNSESPSRTMRGPVSRHRSGRRSCQSRAGSIRWSSTETNQVSVIKPSSTGDPDRTAQVTERLLHDTWRRRRPPPERVTDLACTRGAQRGAWSACRSPFPAGACLIVGGCRPACERIEDLRCPRPPGGAARPRRPSPGV